jgi:hypothetical protein
VAAVKTVCTPWLELYFFGALAAIVRDIIATTELWAAKQGRTAAVVMAPPFAALQLAHAAAARGDVAAIQARHKAKKFTDADLAKLAVAAIQNSHMLLAEWCIDHGRQPFGAASSVLMYIVQYAGSVDQIDLIDWIFGAYAFEDATTMGSPVVWCSIFAAARTGRLAVVEKLIAAASLSLSEIDYTFVALEAARSANMSIVFWCLKMCPEIICEEDATAVSANWEDMRAISLKSIYADATLSQVEIMLTQSLPQLEGWCSLYTQQQISAQ